MTDFRFIKKLPVDCPELEALGYDADARILRVWFPDKTVRDFEDVPRATYLSLTHCSDLAAFFKNNILYAFRVAEVSVPLGSNRKAA